ncbi:hypothetical protein BN2476_520040 [Paraburkholderia piptadeniae]|uniref:Uncharacterized protein n=1 Tax=Paraburkholderia piptadeniae TaxID=1701573 RepID=A0A1N7SGT9_9BURK|nr:hypothetical protein BN2476_520040 [Paraburkholderia piptadeniae]
MSTIRVLKSSDCFRPLNGCSSPEQRNDRFRGTPASSSRVRRRIVAERLGLACRENSIECARLCEPRGRRLAATQRSRSDDNRAGRRWCVAGISGTVASLCIPGLAAQEWVSRHRHPYASDGAICVRTQCTRRVIRVCDEFLAGICRRRTQVGAEAGPRRPWRPRIALYFAGLEAVQSGPADELVVPVFFSESTSRLPLFAVMICP